MVEDRLLPPRLIYRQLRLALQLAYGLRRLCALADELHNLLIQFVDLLSPVGDVHAASSLRSEYQEPLKANPPQISQFQSEDHHKWLVTEEDAVTGRAQTD